MKNNPIVTFILPVYQAESFIYQNLERFSRYCKTSRYTSEIIAVNDGSTDNTEAVIRKFMKQYAEDALVRYIKLERNSGKGLAVKKGVEAARGDYIVFTDCDLQYTFDNISDLVSALTLDSKKIVIANRMRKDSVYRIRSENLTYIYIRHTAGRIYNRLINLITRLNIEDTQAGLKGFDRETARFLFGKISIHGFTFDVEILTCAKENQIEISSIPIEFNYNEEMSTINFIKQVIIMSFDLIKIYFKRMTGYYRA